MTDLAQLIGRLEAASEGSRELDTDVFLAAEPGRRRWGGGNITVPVDEPDHWVFTREQHDEWFAEWKARPVGPFDKGALNAKHGTPWFDADHAPLALYDERRFYASHENPNRRTVPTLSTSIDAIVALIERKLPGWGWAVGKRPSEGGWARVFRPTGPEVYVEASTPALAMCIAFLKAMEQADG